ncbi:MAG: YlmC/YmxH family sporulation protein [Erysipelotrichaceae bacterium]|nr:YlmC/YmxH family sporulation protein [Erysipelotrichaceae bacterium]
MNLSDLQNKEVIDIATGRRIGSIIDVIIDTNGVISKLVLEDRKTTRKFLIPNREDVYLSWKQIVKIGDDIILVDGKDNLEYK